MNTGLRTKRIIAVVLVIVTWFAVASIGGQKFGQLSTVANNNQSSFLPASAESTKVQNILPRFQESNSIPAVVVIQQDRPLTSTDLKNYNTLAGKLRGINGIVGSSPSGVIGPIASKDQRAVEFIAQIDSVKKSNDVVTKIRNLANASLPGGATAYVTGPAGLGAALVNAFKGIDGTLLYVALIAVFIILLFVYRSIVLPILVLITAGFALSVAGFAVYEGVRAGWFKLNGQSQGILSILVIGAATDYSLLLTARFREALETHESRWEAMRLAYKKSAEPILAAGSTVILALLCLLLSDLNSNKSLGPIAAFGIIFSLLSGLTFLPAMLLVFGRKAYWPFPPVFQRNSHKENARSLWNRIPAYVSKKSTPIWIVTSCLLLIAAVFVFSFKASGVSETATILGNSNAVTGQNVLSKHFPAGSGSPVLVIASTDQVPEAIKALHNTPDISSVNIATSYSQNQPPKPIVVNNKELISATLNLSADSKSAENIVKSLRHEFSDTGIMIGGTTAIQLDTNNTARADLWKIIPIVLSVILLILIVLLRSIVAPVLLILTVILSYTATLGVSAIVFNHIAHFPGADAAIPLFGFVFLVALGIDYNIFLMTRIREESKNIGTRPGILNGLSLTGSVITSAGIVLAATFAALAVVPVLFLIQIAFIVAFGVLLDTIIVRTLLVPALSYDIGKLIWWPSHLSRQK